MKKKFFCSVVLASVLSAGQVSAQPMAPGEGWVGSNFSEKVTKNFTLYVDSDNPKLVYYISRFGGIADRNGAPAFGVSDLIPSYGFFAGQDLARVGGSFSTIQSGSLQLLLTEANQKGFIVAPAPVVREKTKASYIIAAEKNESGRVDIKCETEEYTGPNGKTVKIPKCVLKDDNTKEFDLSDPFQKFVSTGASSSSADATLTFQALSTPDGTGPIKKKMESGANWSDLFVTEVQWEVAGAQKTHRADLVVHWKELYERLDAWAAIHNNACVDVEVNYFMENLVRCNEGEMCGVEVFYYRTNPETGVYEKTKEPSNSAEFIAVVNETKEKLENDLFLKVEAFGKPHFGELDRSSSALVSVKANYEKRTRDTHDTYELHYNPGTVPLSATTVLDIDCLKTDDFGSVVSWDNDQAHCKTNASLN